MKVEIYEEQKRLREEPVRLRLIYKESSILLCAVDASGTVVAGGHLLEYIPETNQWTKLLGVSSDLGFRLNDDGALIIRY